MAEYTKNILRTEGRPSQVPEGMVSLDLGDIDTPVPRFRPEGWHLYNYNIAANVMKREHEQFLRETLTPFLNGRRCHVRLIGHTSASGPADANRSLSLQRILLMKEFLHEKCGLLSTQVAAVNPATDAQGESQANRADDEDAFDRGVFLKLYGGRLRIPPPPRVLGPFPITITGERTVDLPPVVIGPPVRRPAKPGEFASTRFYVRYTGGAEATPLRGFGTMGHNLEFVNPRTGAKRNFYLVGGAVGAGTPMSMSWPGGTYSLIEFKDPHDLEELGGTVASIYGAGALHKTTNRLALHAFPSKSDPATNAETELSTGFTLGGGMSNSTGVLVDMGGASVIVEEGPPP